MTPVGENVKISLHTLVVLGTPDQPLAPKQTMFCRNPFSLLLFFVPVLLRMTGSPRYEFDIAPMYEERFFLVGVVQLSVWTRELPYTANTACTFHCPLGASLAVSDPSQLIATGSFFAVFLVEVNDPLLMVVACVVSCLM